MPRKNVSALSMTLRISSNPGGSPIEVPGALTTSDAVVGLSKVTDASNGASRIFELDVT